MALGFMMSIGLLMPLIAGTPIDTIVKLALLGMVVLDFAMLGFVKVYIPEDRIVLGIENRSKGMNRIYKLVYILVPLSAFILIGLFYFLDLPFILNIAIGATPLLVVGLFAQEEENAIFKRDKIFPAFIRALGSIIDIKSGAVLSSVNSLRIHDFGSMNVLIISLYRRLRTGNDKYKCWDFFGYESGSYLIYQFSNIFAESLYLGGSGEKIGEIVSDNFTKLLSLRRLRIQLSSGVRGALYGSLVGFTLAAYMSAELTSMLGGIFSAPFADLQGGEISGFLAGIAPSTALEVNAEMIMFYIGIMVIIHAAVSALIIKIVDGGSLYSTFFDFVVLLWLGTVISIVLPWGLRILLPGLAGVPSG
jgi:flagellar protein FlaJ